MEEILLLLLFVWLILPIPLLILYLTARGKNKRLTALLQKLWQENRVTPEELQAAQMRFPAAQQPTVPAALPQSIPASGHVVAPVLTPQSVKLPETSDTPDESAEKRPQTPEPAAALPDALPQTPEPTPADIPAETAKPLLTPPVSLTPPTVFTPPVSRPQTDSGFAVRPDAPAVAYIPPVPAKPSAPQKELQISSISVVLGMGVLLIVTAAILFLRSTWSSMGNFGKLFSLIGCSAVFFGAAALAGRQKLSRTQMAFFTVGSAVMPLSFYAGGYLGLLGENLSGADNPMLIGLSMLIFCVISLIAVRMFRLTGWGIAFLTALTVAVLQIVRGDFFALGASLWCFLLCYIANILREHLPLPLSRPIEPFALGYAFLTVLILLGCAFDSDIPAAVMAGAGLLTAASFYAPAITKYLKEFTSLSMLPALYIGFRFLAEPLKALRGPALLQFRTGSIIAVTMLFCILTMLILLLTGSLPSDTGKGHRIVLYTLSGLCSVVLVCVSPNLAVCVCSVLAVLLLAVSVRKENSPAAKAAFAGMLGAAVLQAGNLLRVGGFLSKAEALAVCTFLSLACFGLLLWRDKLRTVFSDLLFLGISAVCGLIVTGMSSGGARAGWVTYCGICSVCLIIVLMWILALRRDSRRPVQYLYACAVPVLLGLLTFSAGMNASLHIAVSPLMTVWTAASLGIGLTTYLTVKKQFTPVRKLLFALTVTPAVCFAVFAENSVRGGWVVLIQLLCALSSALLYVLLVKRGMRTLAASGLTAAVILFSECIGYSAKTWIYDGELNFTAAMLAVLPVLCMCILSGAIRRRILYFNGSDIIPGVMQFLGSLTAFILSCWLISLEQPEWHSFFFVFTVIVCGTAWLATDPQTVLWPFATVFSLLLSLESFRIRTAQTGAVYTVILLLCYAGLTVLLPYVGIVLREDGNERPPEKRGWALTIGGGMIPFFLAAASTGYHTDYTGTQCDWLRFFVPVLLAGFVLHFLAEAKSAQSKRAIRTASAGLFTVALWLQPFFDVTDTYWEGKLHLIPLLLFAGIIRYLYGAQQGSVFMFICGCYAMLRLAFGAMASESAADLLTVLSVAMVMFIASFIIKQKKWFLLGGGSLVLTVAYMHMRLTNGEQWWVYLLLAGLILIVLAASNEMLKTRGDSLKARAGRLWEDWKW